MSEAVEAKFIVRRKFKYGDRTFLPGDTFVPAGGKFDDKIIRHLCRLDTDAFKPRERLGPRRKATMAKMSAKREAKLARRALRNAKAKPADTVEGAPAEDVRPKAPRKRAHKPEGATHAD